MQTCCETSRFQMQTLGGKPGSRVPPWRGIGDFREIEMTTAYEGTLFEFIRFLSEVERTESFVRVNSFTCSVGRNWSVDLVTEPLLHVAINVSTFRFEERAR